MSGIAGILSSATDDLRTISAMTDLLAHRGPQGDGILWLKDGGTHTLLHDALPTTKPIPARLAIGHRRLPTHGNAAPQPLASADGRYWIILDGLLYDRFDTTDSDAAIILSAYQAEGEACFAKLNGAWALAIVDTQERTLILARDPQGLRPLYHWAHRGKLVFASEIKALFAVPEIRPKLERHVLGEFLRMGELPGGTRTAFAHIHHFPPGHYARMPFDTPAPVKPIAFAPALVASSPLSESDALTSFRDTFFATIERYRAGPLDVGVCLTGGLASTAIACALRQQIGERTLLNSFTAIVDETGHDARTWVTAANSAAHTLSNWVTPDAEDFLAELDTVLWHHDEPFADASTYAQWCVARAAREAKISVLLDGIGTRPLHPPANPSLLAKLLPRRDAETRAIARLLGPAITLPPVADHLSGALRRGDRNCMAFGVELRTPYLAPELADIARRAPHTLRQERQLLRRALPELLPDPIGTRAPTPAFRVPLEQWMPSILAAFMRDITHARLPLVPLIHGGALREMVTHQMQRPDAALAPLLFRLFIANRWMQRFNVAPVS